MLTLSIPGPRVDFSSSPQVGTSSSWPFGPPTTGTVTHTSSVGRCPGTGKHRRHLRRIRVQHALRGGRTTLGPKQALPRRGSKKRTKTPKESNRNTQATTSLGIQEPNCKHKETPMYAIRNYNVSSSTAVPRRPGCSPSPRRTRRRRPPPSRRRRRASEDSAPTRPSP